MNLSFAKAEAKILARHSTQMRTYVLIDNSNALRIAQYGHEEGKVEHRAGVSGPV